MKEIRHRFMIRARITCADNPSNTRTYYFSKDEDAWDERSWVDDIMDASLYDTPEKARLGRENAMLDVPIEQLCGISNDEILSYEVITVNVHMTERIITYKVTTSISETGIDGEPIEIKLR